MLRIVADNTQMALSTDDFAFSAYFLYRCFYFHIKNADRGPLSIFPIAIH